MKWIEVIQLRTINSNQEALEERLKELTAEINGKKSRRVIRMYNREQIHTDICIVLFQDTAKKEPGGSEPGLRLASALKEFGLVNHSTWIEMR